MTSTATDIRRNTQPQPLVSAGARLATAFAVAAVVSAAWMGAGHESRAAVQSSAAAMAPHTLYVTLPTVEIVGHREAASAAVATAGTLHLASPTL